ncbi:MAG TPA: hypothetical protein VLY63_20455 [Anaerolineae bacterium]|nr:hypothetical protein [Anaerolineae bacterium]
MAVLKRMLPTAVAIAVGIFVLLAVFTPSPMFDAVSTYFIDTAIIIAAFALFLGVINVLRVHARKIQMGGPGGIFSVVLIASMLIVLVIGLPALPGRPSGPSQPIVQWIFEYIQTPVQASLSALLVFFVLTAAYRLLLLRNLESAVMLLVVLIVLIGQVSLGLVPVLPKLRDWVLNVPVLAGVRGILLGVALGAVLTGIRLLLGVERPYSD